MKVAIVTAGGAGMFCGSCMQDNTLARTLRSTGVDAVLVPTYTPIRVDEENVSNERVFMGGINVYLDSAIPGWRLLPGWVTNWLNHPSVIRRLSQFGSTDASKLGSLTLDMLKGEAGPQKREVEEFTNYICNELKPDVVLFSNALLSGILKPLRSQFGGRILCLLQGDDIFLDALTHKWRPQVLQQLQQNCQLFDGFLTHSRFYQDHMADHMSLSADRFRQIPLTIDVDRLPAKVANKDEPSAKTTIGYFARICPEKGIHNLLAAAESVLPDHPHAEVVIAGFLPRQHRKWFEKLRTRAERRTPGRIRWLGSPDGRDEKFDIIRGFDYLCVPTDYQEPKGLYVLEAGMAEVASILPAHGAFPELIEGLGTGTLYDPKTPDGLSTALRTALVAEEVNHALLPDKVTEIHGMQATASVIERVIRSFL